MFWKFIKGSIACWMSATLGEVWLGVGGGRDYWERETVRVRERGTKRAREILCGKRTIIIL